MNMLAFQFRASWALQEVIYGDAAFALIVVHLGAINSIPGDRSSMVLQMAGRCSATHPR